MVADSYEQKLLLRTKELEGRAHAMNKQRKELIRSQNSMHESSQELLQSIREELDRLDADTKQLALRVKKLITSLQRVAMQEQLRIVEQKVNMFNLGSMISKNEVKKIVEKEVTSFSDE